jgi:hypothetical protein
MVQEMAAASFAPVDQRSLARAALLKPIVERIVNAVKNQSVSGISDGVDEVRLVISRIHLLAGRPLNDDEPVRKAMAEALGMLLSEHLPTITVTYRGITVMAGTEADPKVKEQSNPVSKVMMLEPHDIDKIKDENERHQVKNTQLFWHAASQFYRRGQKPDR